MNTQLSALRFLPTRLVAPALSAVIAAGTLACGPAADADDHAITMEVRLNPNGDQVGFVSPAGSVIETPVADIVGKPYFAAIFEAGFSSGNDLPLYEEWGTMPADLDVDIAAPPQFEDGAAYDMVFVVYVTSDVMIGDEPPAAINGDLATFTIDQSVIREGDPQIVPGVVRIVIDGENAIKRVENRLPEDPDDSASFTEAMTDTIMIVP